MWVSTRSLRRPPLWGALSPEKGPTEAAALVLSTLASAEASGSRSCSDCHHGNPASAFRCTEGTPGRSELGKLRPGEVKGPPEVTHQVWAEPSATFALASGCWGKEEEGQPWAKALREQGPWEMGPLPASGLGPPASLLLVSGRRRGTGCCGHGGFPRPLDAAPRWGRRDRCLSPGEGLASP